MSLIQYKKGDLFEVIKDDFDGFTYIPHVVNTFGYWASGFVVPMAKFMPEAKSTYEEMYTKNEPELEHGKPNEHLLGYNQYIQNDNFIAVNMFAQLFATERPLNYNALVHCMNDLVEKIGYKTLCGLKSRIVAPKFGSLRAGGNWDFIEKLIEDCWTNNGIDVTIVSFEEIPEFAGVKDVDHCDSCNSCDGPFVYFMGDDKFYCLKCYSLAYRGEK